MYIGVRDVPAEEHDDRVCLCGDETQQKGIAAATVVAFEDRVAQRPVRMQRDLLVLRPHKMVDNVAGRRVAAPVCGTVCKSAHMAPGTAKAVYLPIAEPLLARQALDHGSRIVQPAVPGVVKRIS